MQVKNFSLNTLPVGAVVELLAADLIGLRYIGEKQGRDRKDEKEALMYHRFGLGNMVFTVGSDDMDSVELLRDAAKRKTIGKLQLEVTEWQRPVADQATGEATDMTESARSLRFHGVITATDLLAVTKTSNEIAKAEAAYAPKPDNAMSADDIAKIVAASIAKYLPTPVVATPAPTQPVVATTEG